MIYLLAIFSALAFGNIAPDLQIQKQSDLVFNESYAGSPSEVITPNTNGSSQFLISGKPNTDIEIELPMGKHFLKAGLNTIAVDDWTSNLIAPINLGPTGRILLSLGAQRESIPFCIAKGIHQGVHRVRARYKGDARWVDEFAHQKIYLLQSIKLIKISDLQFSNAHPGAIEEVIAPQSPKHAEFEVVGEPDRLFTILLPGVNGVYLTSTTSQSPSDKIPITFFSEPGSQGKLNVEGKQKIWVGASRAQLPETLSPGLYQATFPVRVVYY